MGQRRLVHPAEHVYVKCVCGHIGLEHRVFTGEEGIEFRCTFKREGREKHRRGYYFVCDCQAFKLPKVTSLSSEGSSKPNTKPKKKPKDWASEPLTEQADI